MVGETSCGTAGPSSIVCLTFADKLYAEHMSNEGKDPDKIFMKRELEHQLILCVELPHHIFLMQH